MKKIKIKCYVCSCIWAIDFDSDDEHHKCPKCSTPNYAYRYKKDSDGVLIGKSWLKFQQEFSEFVDAWVKKYETPKK